MKYPEISDQISNFIRENYYYEDGKVYSRAKMSAWINKPLGWSNGYHKQVTLRLKGAKRKNILLHHIVWFLHHNVWPKQLDHDDGNPFNNQIENLRECNQSQNIANSKPIKRFSGKKPASRFKGVSKRKRVCKKPWQAKAQQTYLGYFSTEIEAARAYNKKALEIWGEFARLNPV